MPPVGGTPGDGDEDDDETECDERFRQQPWGIQHRRTEFLRRTDDGGGKEGAPTQVDGRQADGEPRHDRGQPGQRNDDLTSVHPRDGGPVARPAQGRSHLLDSAVALLLATELRNNNAEVMRRVAEGQSFTVTVHGRPVVDLLPHRHETSSRRRLVPAAEFDEALAQLPPVDAALWRRDVEDADKLLGDDLPTDPRDGAVGR